MNIIFRKVKLISIDDITHFGKLNSQSLLEIWPITYFQSKQLSRIHLHDAVSCSYAYVIGNL